jgi:hypothetical protein
MFELINNKKKLATKGRCTSFNVSYLKTETIFYGVYTKQHILHNLRLKIQQGLSEKNSYRTYVRAGMTDWNYLMEDPFFLEFWNDVIDDNAYGLQPGGARTDFKLLEAWGNVMKESDEIKPHGHESYHGILYLTDGPPLIFTEANICFFPQAGKYIISPPNMMHMVEKHKSELERISLVFNFRVHDDFKIVNEDAAHEGEKANYIPGADD